MIAMPTNPRFKDETGARYGRWFVVGFHSCRRQGRSSSAYWLCRCDCGQTKIVVGSTLRNGASQSCGCLVVDRCRFDPPAEVHGLSGDRVYRIWRSMKDRCETPSSFGYDEYGGRGVVVCPRWSNSFEAFFADMGHPPTANHSIDRIDNDGDYEPNNCRWATRSQQGRNKRTNHLIAIGGEVLCLAEWATRSGNSRHTIKSRLKRGWDAQQAVFQPPDERHRSNTPTQHQIPPK